MDSGKLASNRLAEILKAEILKFDEIFEAARYPLEEILPFLNDPDPRVRAKTAEALRYKRDINAIGPLSSLLDDPDRSVKSHAALAIAAIPSPDSETKKSSLFLDALIDASRDSWMQRDAVRALSWSGEPRVAQPLIDALCNLDPDPKLYEPVSDGLIRIGKPAVEPLIAALDNKYDHVRELAADVLGQLGDTRAVEPLIRSLQADAESVVRQSAATALGKLGDLRATRPLIAALRDTNNYVRWSAVEALGELSDTSAIKPLEEMLDAPMPELQAAVQKSLSRLMP